VNRAPDALLDPLDVEARLDKARGPRVEDVAFQSVAVMIVEDRPPVTALRPRAVDLNRRLAARPGFAVNQQVRIDRPQLTDDRFERFDINQPEQVEAES